MLRFRPLGGAPNGALWRRLQLSQKEITYTFGVLDGASAWAPKFQNKSPRDRDAQSLIHVGASRDVAAAVNSTRPLRIGRRVRRRRSRRRDPCGCAQGGGGQSGEDRKGKGEEGGEQGGGRGKMAEEAQAAKEAAARAAALKELQSQAQKATAAHSGTRSSRIFLRDGALHAAQGGDPCGAAGQGGERNGQGGDWHI